LSQAVHRDDVLKEIGYKEPPSGKLLDLIDEMLKEGNSLIEPFTGFREVTGEKGLPRFLQGSALGYIAVISLGPGLETAVKELFDSGKPTEGYLLDVVGSLAVMRGANLLWADIMADAASKGVEKGMRRAPGCNGVPMEFQRWIIEAFHDPAMGVEVTSSNMLVPRKSFAFFGRFGGKLEGAFPCKGCPQFLNCDLRG
jgi:hypothetical protein